MSKSELRKLIDDLLLPLGFKRKGAYWTLEGSELTKMVNLQKSQNGDLFYINYGFNLHSISENNGEWHIYGRLVATNPQNHGKANELLDLENQLADHERNRKIRELIRDDLLPILNRMNTEEDVFEDLKKRPHLNDVFLKVKRHFGFSE